VGFGSVTKVSKLSGREKDDCARHLLGVAASDGLVVFVSRKPRFIEIECSQVRRVLSDYLEDDLAPELRVRIEEHLQDCDHCKAVHDGLRNIVLLLGDEEIIELPKGFSRRLYRRLSGGT